MMSELQRSRLVPSDADDRKLGDSSDSAIGGGAEKMTELPRQNYPLSSRAGAEGLATAVCQIFYDANRPLRPLFGRLIRLTEGVKMF